MSDGMTLRSLIDLSKADIEKALAEHAKVDTDAARGLGHLGGFAAAIGAEQLNKALDVDVYELLAKAWTTVQAVHDAATKSRLTPGQPTLISLGAHDLRHICQPVLKLFVADVALPDLRLTLELVARFNSVKVSIADARLRSVAPGDASVIARLWYKSVQLKEKSSPVWKLPGEIPLGPGVPID
jgi:hypothetical protein